MRTALPRLERILEEEGEIVVTGKGKPVAACCRRGCASRSPLIPT
jgi:hypothetical protein